MDDNNRMDSNMELIWNEIFENSHKQYRLTPSIYVAEKKEKHIVIHYASRTFCKLMCLLDVAVLSLPYAESGLFSNQKDWRPKDGPQKFASFIFNGMFTYIDVNKSRRLDNKYKNLVDFLSEEVEKYIQLETTLLKERITTTFALWKWAEKKRIIPSDSQIIDGEELEYSDLDEVISQLILSVREKTGVYNGLPEKWYDPYELLAGMVLFALVLIPLSYKDDAVEASFSVYKNDDVFIKQKEIQEKIVEYFRNYVRSKESSDESKNDFGIQIVEKWSDKVFEIIKISEEIDVSIPDATGNHEITLHVNMQQYGEFYNRKYVRALMNHLDDEIEKLLAFLQNQLDGLSRMAEKLEFLRKVMQNSNNPMMIEAFVKEINESGKTYSIGTVNNKEWRNE